MDVRNLCERDLSIEPIVSAGQECMCSGLKRAEVEVGHGFHTLPEITFKNSNPGTKIIALASCNVAICT